MALAAPGALAAKPSELAELAEAMNHDELQMVSVKGLDLAYARPGASLAGYKRVQLEPVKAAFRKDWNPSRH